MKLFIKYLHRIILQLKSKAIEKINLYAYKFYPLIMWSRKLEEQT